MGSARGVVLQEDLTHIAATDIPWDRLEGKRILISGASGFLAAYLVETVLFLNDTRFKDKATVYGIVRNEANARARFAHHKGREDLRLIVQDVCVPIRIDGPVEFIIHAASNASPKHFGKDPVGTLDANLTGTRNLLSLAHEKRVEAFLFFSTSEVYGSLSGEGAPIREDEYGYLNPLSVRSCYAEGKRAGETMCVSWLHQFGVPARIVRPFHIYGPGVGLEDGRVFADFVSNIVRGQDILMKSDGTAVRCFCYIADAAAAFFTVLLKGEDGHAYNVGDSTGVISIRDLAQLLVGLYPEKGLQVRMDPGVRSDGYIKSEFVRLIPSLDKIHALGWRAQIPLKNGFDRTVRSYL